jgi:hypothetical protein
MSVWRIRHWLAVKPWLKTGFLSTVPLTRNQPRAVVHDSGWHTGQRSWCFVIVYILNRPMQIVDVADTP